MDGAKEPMAPVSPKYSAKSAGMGKISLRRAQFRLAEKNANMAIWLGKQYLRQTDTIDLESQKIGEEDDPITKSLKEEQHGPV